MTIGSASRFCPTSFEGPTLSFSNDGAPQEEVRDVGTP